jgi:DnaA family protein
MRQLPLAVRLRERARFANFVAGPNETALTAVRKLAAGAGGVSLVTGPPSSGKSHLLLAAIAEAAGSGRSVAYFALRELGAGAADALRPGGATHLICCDDIDLYAADAVFGQALFALWREQEERGGALLLAARTPLAAQRWALADFGSRLRGIAQHQALQLLDDEGQRQVLLHRAQDYGLGMPSEVIEFLLRRMPRDLATLCAAVDELDQAALAAQRRLTVPFVRAVLAERLALTQSGGDFRDPPT